MIWFDFDNSPHVPLYRPILTELGNRGVETFVTSRAHAQVQDLLQLWNIPHFSVGGHGGKSKWKKIANLIQRAHGLTRAAKEKPIILSVSHNCRTHMLASKWLGIRYLGMDDYEYSEQRLANLLADYVLLPICIPDERIAAAGLELKKVIRYEGFKEQIYLKDFIPQSGLRKSIGVAESAILVTMRPPSTTAHYHSEKSERLFRRCLDHFSSFRNTYCIIVNRTAAERRLVPEELLHQGKAGWLPHAVDGLQLLWQSDLVVGGGGTMNREAALLGVPTISIFTGRRPAVDEQLESEGALKFINHEQDVETISVQKRAIPPLYRPTNINLASWLSDLILDISKR
jgi:predicted glycosyltransferase